MNTWTAETSLPDEKEFYISLNMEGITNVDYRHAKRVFNDFNNKNIGDYHDLYVQSDTLLLADVYENFRNMGLKVYELDPTHFLPLPGLAWLVCLKKTEVRLELLADVDVLLMVEEEIRGGIYHAIHRYAKANNEYAENYNKHNESSYIQYWEKKNFYKWKCLKNYL